MLSEGLQTTNQGEAVQKYHRVSGKYIEISNFITLMYCIMQLVSDFYFLTNARI